MPLSVLRCGLTRRLTARLKAEGELYLGASKGVGKTVSLPIHDRLAADAHDAATLDETVHSKGSPNGTDAEHTGARLHQSGQNQVAERDALLRSMARPCRWTTTARRNFFCAFGHRAALCRSHGGVHGAVPGSTQSCWLMRCSA